MLKFFKYKPTEDEHELIDLVDKMLQHPKTNVKLTQLSKKNYIVNEDLHYYILLKSKGIQLVNTKFTIFKTLDEKAYEIIMDKVYAYVEKDADNIDDIIFKSEKLMLNEVKHKLEFANA